MNNKQVAFFLLGVTVLFSSCQAVGDIFKAGAWTAIIGIIIVVAIIFWIISKVSGGNKS
ncbi:MAG: hypothetical protein M3R72_12510 [Bacteroidota bacterium]|nr:hypothetical protein [Bacteroidota bacterium]